MNRNIPGNVTIALVIDDEIILRETNEILTRSYPNGVKVVGQWQDFNSGFAMLKECKPTIALIGVYSEEKAGVLLLAEKASALLLETQVFMISTNKKAETLLSAMRAGIKECLIAPTDTNELLNAVERVRKQLETKRGSPRLIGVISAKGGIGTTTVAVNLAIALKRVTGQKVFLVDNHISGGDDVALFLNLQPRQTLKDVMENIGRLDSALLSGYTVEHPSGLRVISGMESLNQVSDSTDRVSALQQLFNFLRIESNYTVVDIGYISSKGILETLKTLDSILLVLTLELAAIRNTKQVLATLEELDLLKKTKLVLNRYDKRYNKGGSAITPEDVVKTLNMPIFHIIPNDYIAVSECINLGLPVITEKHKSPVSQSFLLLAELISTADVAGTFNKKL